MKLFIVGLFLVIAQGAFAHECHDYRSIGYQPYIGDTSDPNAWIKEGSRGIGEGIGEYLSNKQRYEVEKRLKAEKDKEWKEWRDKMYEHYGIR